MSARVATMARSLHNPLGQTVSLDRCRAVLRDLDEDPAVAKAVFEGVAEADLMSLGLRTFRMNYYAIYGDSHPQAAIDRVAERALRLKLWFGWDHHAYLEHMGAGACPPRIGNLPVAAIEALRARHGGLVLATFQFGAVRDIFAGLACAGLPVTFALANSVYEEYRRSRDNNPDAAIWRCGHLADAESVEGVASLGHALDRGEIILLCLDGNTGITGAHDLTGRLEIGFLGQRAHVKTGVARIAARHGKPILPLLAPLTRRGPKCFRIGAAIDPGARLAGPEAKAFAVAATETIYRRFERYVRHFPEQWGVVESFHRWRTPQPGAAALAPAEIEARLDDGAHVRVAPCSIVTSAVWEDQVLVTGVRTLRSLRVPGSLLPLLARLSGDEGLDRRRFDALEDSERSRGIALIGALGALDCLRFDHKRAGHAAGLR